jgi:hypothetical protein
MAFDSDGALKDPTKADRQAVAVLDVNALWTHSLNHLRTTAA